jgi:hypothetical protein
MKRRSEFDIARGLMLVLMTITHLPTRFSVPTGQPFGYVSAAEGFVLLSAFMAGMVYTGKADKEDLPYMRRAFLSRTTTVYACHAALLLFLFTAIAKLGLTIDQPAVKNLMQFYLADPITGLWTGLLLIYNPPLLDILPLYIVLLAISPFVLTVGLKHGWRGVLATSAVIWLLAQFGLGAWLYGWLVHFTGLSVPLRETGSFDTFAWQFLWVIGLWMGSRMARSDEGLVKEGRVYGEFPRWLLRFCIAYAAVFFVWRHVAGQVPWPTHGDNLFNELFDKWPLAPLRLINLFALVVLAIQYGAQLLARLPSMRWLEVLGTASLPVFCAHLVGVLLVLAILGPIDPNRPLWIDFLVIVVGLALLTGVAVVSREFDRRAAEREQRARQRRAERRLARMARP